MRIQHNVMAMNAYRNYTNNVSAMKKNLEKLSSGYRINRAGDDAAGLAISEKMRAQITGLETAQKNAKDGISLVQTAEGALTEVHDMLNRMVELATQSANGTYDNTTDRAQMQKELDQLRTEINRIADSANFNGIKLFDGSLSGADITASGIETSMVDMAKGIDVVQGNKGGGSNGVYTINLDSALTKGDILEIKFDGAAKTDLGGAGTGVLALTYGGTTSTSTNLAGTIGIADDVAGQAANIAKALSKNAAITKNFDVKVDGNSVTLTAKIEGNNTTVAGDNTNPQTSTVTGVNFQTDKNFTAAQHATDWTATAADALKTSGAAVFKNLISTDAGAGVEIKDNDVITIDLKLDSGKTLSVSATAGKDFDVAATDAGTYDNLIDYLNNKATLTDDESTVIDESKMKFGDLFKASNPGPDATDKGTSFVITQEKGNTGFGSLDAANTAANASFTRVREGAADVTRTHEDGDSSTGVKTVADTKANSKYDLVLATGTTDATNLTIGDKLTIEGKLADGRDFSVTLEAGKDFKVGDAYTDTLTNLKKVLESDNLKIQLKDNGVNSDVVKASDIFGDDKEIKVTAAATGTFTSVDIGKGASAITKATLDAADPSSVSNKLSNGEQRSAAESTITLNDGVEYGAVVEVDGKKYELVKAAGDVSNANHKAVIVDDISDVNSAAKALADALKADLNSANYTVTTSNNKVTVSSTKVGSTAQAVTASALGDKTTQLEFTLDPKKMKAGSTVTINGQTYEFINKGDNASKKEYIGLEVSNFDKETAASLGGALAKAANGQKNASVTMDENGKVTVRGLVDSETNKIVTPNVRFDGGTSGLKLQIGDTAEDFNQMTVSIYNMHCADMGIGGISIADQDSAAVAIDAIKSAINYVSDVRGTLGATQNRLDHTINNLSVMTENIQDAESTIRDTDVAAEMMAYTKNNILIQSAQAMLAQANQVPQGVLQLLQ